MDSLKSRDPKVSVVIPTYKGAGCIIDAVHTVKNQTYSNIETIVVIDGSEDGTLELLECYKAGLPVEEQNNFQIISQKNGGVSVARNTGMQMASGKYVALLDHDDEWHPEKLNAQMTEVLNHPNQDHIFCTTDHESLDINSGERTLQRNGKSLDIIGLVTHTGAQPSTWLMSKSVSEKIGGFDEQLRVGEDGDYLFKAMHHGDITFVNVDKALSTYKVGDENSLSSGNEYAPNKLPSLVKGFENSYNILKEALPSDMFEQFINWHKQHLPEDMFKDSLHRVENLGVDTSLGRFEL